MELNLSKKRIDVSEVKSYRECRRKWRLSSRNGFHLRSKVTSDALQFGTVFHECLHKIYLGGDIDKIVEYGVDNVYDPVQRKVMAAVIYGYYTEAYQIDKEIYRVLDIEHGFGIEFPELPNIVVCGSIDMVAIDKRDGKLYGFEHKSAAKFRPSYYNWMDEQPRLYAKALKKYAAELGVEYGGIFLNQVKKVQKNFEMDRVLLQYTDKDLDRFFSSFVASCKLIQLNSSDLSELDVADPSYMKCQMCDYKNVCEFFGYETIEKTAFLDEFGDEFEVRDTDHLDEKVERSTE
jgi:CRISPR/Cas system-associated exonuclease Cas4 (RecB family)